jgi:hypothetical protein
VVVTGQLSLPIGRSERSLGLACQLSEVVAINGECHGIRVAAWLAHGVLVSYLQGDPLFHGWVDRNRWRAS